MLFAAAAIFKVAGETDRVVAEQRLLAVDPGPVGNAEAVVRLILSSCAPSSRYAIVSV